jgi:hypothetical protein
MCALARAMGAVDKLFWWQENRIGQLKCLSQVTTVRSAVAIAMTGQIAVAGRPGRSKFHGSASPHFTFSMLCFVMLTK